MLTDEEKTRVRDLLAHYRHARAADIEALKIVQDGHGWVDDASLAELAGLVGMSPTDLEGVATFYNLIFRRPVGRNVIFICNSISCWIRGFGRLYDYLQQRLGIQFGQTTPNGAFTLLPIVCLGACDHAPTMMINGQLYEDLTTEKIDQALREAAGGGQ